MSNNFIFNCSYQKQKLNGKLSNSFMDLIPTYTGSYYYNNKQFFSIVLMAVVNYNYEFNKVHVSITGQILDWCVLGYTVSDFAATCKKKLPFVFIEDDAFVLTEYCMKPYSQTGLITKKTNF